MGIGTSERIVEVPQDPCAAFIEFRSALEHVGKVKEADEADLYLRGTTRYGLQRIRLKIDIAAGQGGSVVTIRGLSDDVWGKGAKKGIEKLLGSLGVA